MTSTTPIEKQITLAQIDSAAKSIGVETNVLRAIMQQECKGSGFSADGQPIILFERHIFLRQLKAHGLYTVASKAQKERPDLCNSTPGGYGLISAQPKRLADAAVYDRTSALESASYGIGQVLGANWSSIGYPTLQAFINDVYRDEAGQLNAMVKFLVANGIVKYMKLKDWKNIALHYNGENYQINHYDTGIANAYAEFEKQK